MESRIDIIRSVFGKYKSLLQTSTGLVSLSTGVISLVNSLTYSKYNIAIICIGVFFIMLGVGNKLISAKKESFGLTVNRLSNGQIRSVKQMILCSYLLWLFPLYVGVKFLRSSNNSCNARSNNLGLVITSFTNSNDDDFSYKLFTLLETELETTDTISAIRTDKFINAGSRDYQDSIKHLFNDNCFDKGLLVFGKRSTQSKLFDCSVYINNVLNVKAGVNFQDKKVINLQNPSLINFSIDYQAQTVSEFILGLLYCSLDKLNLSTQKLQHCSDLIRDDENRKLKSYCALFIGNNLFKENQYTTAIARYEAGISYDSTNAYCHFNLATALLHNQDSLRAYEHYVTANNINRKLINPLENSQINVANGKQESSMSLISKKTISPVDTGAW